MEENWRHVSRESSILTITGKSVAWLVDERCLDQQLDGHLPVKWMTTLTTYHNSCIRLLVCVVVLHFQAGRQHVRKYITPP